MLKNICIYSLYVHGKIEGKPVCVLQNTPLNLLSYSVLCGVSDQQM